MSYQKTEFERTTVKVKKMQMVEKVVFRGILLPAVALFVGYQASKPISENPNFALDMESRFLAVKIYYFSD